MEPSSPLRHATELVLNIQNEFTEIKPVLFLYTDGGPDHRITYLSVQLSLISVFLSLDSSSIMEKSRGEDYVYSEPRSPKRRFNANTR